AEFGMVSRNELSGVLAGLFRTRIFTQDDVHIFLTREQIEQEVTQVMELIDHFYSKVFGFDYHVELSTRPEKFMGDVKDWNKAEATLEQILKKRKMKYKVNKGDGAFYGPKIDFHIKDSLGRTWQLATVQLDFQMPEKFDLHYVDEKGQHQRPVIIHNVVYGSLERFMGILIEHYQGRFPLWLSPIQARIVSFTDRNEKYARQVEQELMKAGLRVDSDFASETVDYKVRKAQQDKVPYTIVIGDKEEKAKTLAVRGRDGKVRFGVKLSDFVAQVREEIEKKK
ncbi:MAG TPA: threonine--tRNA ligase, partial [Nanoarchaeota archaeon]|nr:threonine--tRNA ligase [Nanoarchaeota archaeon]